MLNWSDSFATKIEIVDLQHQKLFDMINTLSESFKEGGPTETAVNETLLQLLAYADKHFVDEELLMLHSKVDQRHINIHRMEHKSFIYDTQSMWQHLCTEDDLVEISEKLVRFTTSWLIFHILGIDKNMAAQIFAIQQGATPEQAFALQNDIKYDSAVTRLMLDSVLDLWHMSKERCHKLEEKLARLT